MIDVLAMGNAEIWDNSPKQLSLSPSHISTSSPSSQVNSDTLQKQTSIASSDWYYFFDSPTTTSYSHSLHYHTPQSQTPEQPQISGNMMTSQGLTNQKALHSRECPIDMPRKVESHAASFGQNLPYFIPQLDFKVPLSSNGSTCESDIDSLDTFEEPYATHTVGENCCLVHPVPKSSVYATGNNITFLSSSDEAYPLSKIETQDGHLDDSVFPHYPNQLSSTCHDNAFGSLGHFHHAHNMASSGLVDAKFSSCDDSLAWSAWNTSASNYAWLSSHNVGDMTYGSGCHTPASHNVPWVTTSNLYRAEGICEPSIHPTGPSTGLAGTPSSHSYNAMVSPSPIHHQSRSPSSTFETASVRTCPKPLFPMQPTYISSPHNVYSDTDTGSVSPSQKLPGSLSPSSFTASSTTEEGPSPQQIRDDQTGIRANMHYSDERNAFLIDCKRRGLSYKDIKRVGGFKEAESTLRGRYRTLTKSKDQRVRKPKWQNKDVHLLCEAVGIYAETTDYGSLTHMGMTINEPPKVSWKKVAEHIWNKGGSYQFGNATCKKKWCEIHDIRI
ncbi:unnamed protein product [Penicillium salamii]|nr:unnamed protein product [Penicillium salamii]